MTKGFKQLVKLAPLTDIKRALALMRFRTTSPSSESLAYASLSVCAKILKISYSKAHQLAQEIVKDNTV